MSKIKFAALLLAFFAINPALAQTLPPVAACGLPAQGAIRQTVTYTLTADCALTGEIVIANATPTITVTINGGGHTITGSSANDGMIAGPNAILNLNHVTIDGEYIRRTSMVGSGTVNANNVTFTRAYGGPALIPKTSVLNNVLFSRNISRGFSLGGNGSAVHAGLNSTHTWNNVVMRNSIDGGGGISLLAGASLTTNGCLTLSGNVPYDIYAPAGTTWTDNSTGLCSGTIGNGDSAVITAPALMQCGFPASGNLDVSATYTLTADCELTGVYYVSEDVSISVIGNARALRSSRTGYSFYTAATSGLQLDNVALEGLRIFNWGDFRADRIVVSNTVNGMIYNIGEARFTNALFKGNSASIASSRSVMLAYNAYQNGYTSFRDVTFSGNTGGRGVLVTFGAVIELKGCITFEDNSPADTYVYTGRGGVVNDNRANCSTPIVDPLIPPVVNIDPPASDAPKAICNPHCPELLLRYCDIKLGAIGLVCRPPEQPPEAHVYRITIVDPLIPPVVNIDPPASDAPKAICNPHCPELLLRYCDIKLGAIGLVCRPPEQPPEAHVYRITSESEGFFKLGLSQPQVEAVEAGLVACSTDGRVAVRTGLPPEIRHFFEIDPKYRAELAVPRRYIIISKGPNVEGKVNHVVLDNALSGRVFGIVSTFGGPPAAECIARQTAEAPTPASVQYAKFVQPQTAQPDGAILHIVRPGDTINGIAVAYEADPLEIIILNQLEHMGRWIYPGQELLIREAGA